VKFHAIVICIFPAALYSMWYELWLFQMICCDYTVVQKKTGPL